jgi:hypothetical protein
VRPFFENDELCLYCGDVRDILPEFPSNVALATVEIDTLRKRQSGASTRAD